MGFIQKILNVLNKNNLKGNIAISIPEIDILSECGKGEFYQKIIVLLKEILIVKVNAKIDRINELSIIMKETTDKDIFYSSMEEIEGTLTELSTIEQSLNLSRLPSEHLKRFRDSKPRQIAFLEKRISQKANESISIMEAYEMLERAKELSEIVNETVDRNEFFNSIEEIKAILRKLSECEDTLPLIGSPSADLKNLEQMEQSQIKLLEKRILKKKKEISDPYKDYYDRINTEKSNNLNISFEDVEKYDMKPFDLKKPFITDGNFTVIELEGENLEYAKAALLLMNRLLAPFNNLYKKPLPAKITTDYILNQKLPYSHLRLNPYTYSYSDREYPILLWLSYFGHYGNEYLYKINFDKAGKVGNCDLQFYNYTVQIRKLENELYVRKISETLKRPPYGTKVLYINKSNRQNIVRTQNLRMNPYDVERYAIECNAYVVREERKEQNKNN